MMHQNLSSALRKQNNEAFAIVSLLAVASCLIYWAKGRSSVHGRHDREHDFTETFPKGAVSAVTGGHPEDLNESPVVIFGESGLVDYPNETPSRSPS